MGSFSIWHWVIVLVIIMLVFGTKKLGNIGSDLGKATQAQLNRGARLMEMLKQPQYLPLPVEKQVAMIYVGTNGHLDEYPITAIGPFEQQFYPFMESKYADVLKTIRESGKIEADTEKKLKDAIAEFKKIFVASEE